VTYGPGFEGHSYVISFGRIAVDLPRVAVIAQLSGAPADLSAIYAVDHSSYWPIVVRAEFDDLLSQWNALPNRRTGDCASDAADRVTWSSVDDRPS
jgi:hypothetical protein